MNATELHDPQKVLGDLRDHLARHDKPIAFLFGAGTSCSIRREAEDGGTRPLVPAVPQLTEICRARSSEESDEFEEAWTAIIERCKETTTTPNVEDVLSRLRMMLTALGSGDSLCGLSYAEVQRLEESIRRTIAAEASPDLDALGDCYPHRRLARWLSKAYRLHPVEIFTLNYDVLIEHALESERVPFFDGFVGSYQPFFHAESLRRAEAAPGSGWIRLWKLHGSVTWRRVMLNGRLRVVRGQPDLSGEMILPSFRKYEESRQEPYVAFTERLGLFLEQEDALLIVSGFSFRDQHVNDIVFRALEGRPRSHVYALQFEDAPVDSDLAKRARQLPNMIMLGPNAAIIGGRYGGWAGKGFPFLSDVFEVTERINGDEGGDPEGLGRMKIGDFACFCSMLDAMATR